MSLEVFLALQFFGKVWGFVVGNILITVSMSVISMLVSDLFIISISP